MLLPVHGDLSCSCATSCGTGHVLGVHTTSWLQHFLWTQISRAFTTSCSHITISAHTNFMVASCSAREFLCLHNCLPPTSSSHKLPVLTQLLTVTSPCFLCLPNFPWSPLSPPVPVQLPTVTLLRSSVNKLQLPSITSLPAHAQFLCSHNLCSYSFLYPPHLMVCISSPVVMPSSTPTISLCHTIMSSPVVTLSYLCHTMSYHTLLLILLSHCHATSSGHTIYSCGHTISYVYIYGHTISFWSYPVPSLVVTSPTTSHCYAISCDHS